MIEYKNLIIKEYYMDFTKLRKDLLDNYQDHIGIYNLLKDGLGANNIDLFYYDNKKGIFFDKINNLILNIKHLNQNSILGNAIMKKEPCYIKNIKEENRYNSAIDNPFNIDMNNQIVIPFFMINGEIKGILRLSQFPSALSEIDFRNINILRKVFFKIFLYENSYNQEDINSQKTNQERLENYHNIKQIEKIYKQISVTNKNLEVDKLIGYARENLKNIVTYTNPNLSNSIKIKKEIKKITKNNTMEESVNILIADDIRINVQILNAMISVYKNIGEVKFAYDGIEALEILNNCIHCDDDINLIFLDHHMPGALGSDIAKELKSNKYKDRDIIIVSITNDKDILEKNRHLYDYHIPKPFSKKNIENVMQKIDIIKK